MDLSVEQDSLGAIESDEFSTSSEILSEETHSLMACSPDNCPDVHVTGSAKQDEGILGQHCRIMCTKGIRGGVSIDTLDQNPQLILDRQSTTIIS